MTCDGATRQACLSFCVGLRNSAGALAPKAASITTRACIAAVMVTLSACAIAPHSGASRPTSMSFSACTAAPLGPVTLYLRGTLNNWTAQEDFAFQYSCDAYYLNVTSTGAAEFKIGDEAWADALTFGAMVFSAASLPSGEGLPLTAANQARGASNLRFDFAGEHTLRLAFPGGRPVLSVGPKSFADPSQLPLTDTVALSIRHDSRASTDKLPFGAVPAGSAVEFAFSALPGVTRATLVIEQRRLEGNQDLLEYRAQARVTMTRSPEGLRERWRASHRFDDIAVYGYHFEVESGGKTYLVVNNRNSVYWTREKGSNGLAVVEEKLKSSKPPRRFRLTVFAPDFKVPEWAGDALYYYVFPERFRNGNPANDPRPGVDTYQNHSVEFHRKWLDQPFKPDSGDGSDAVFNNDFFGGDLQGVIDKLDYIAGLGANTIYLTPVFAAASNHGYDTADYRHIAARFGTDADFTRLTKEASARGIRVITDTSLNHTGSDSIYFDRFSKYLSRGAFEGGSARSDSPYADWYSFDATQSAPDLQYKGWVGVRDLPELNKQSKSFRRFAYDAPDSVMKLWLDRGSAGWRMDVAPWVPDDFWREWRLAIKAHRPDALTIAEAWFDSSKYFLGDTFDSTMNYIFRSAVLAYAAGGDARAEYQPLEYLREVYPPQAFHALMNLLSTHDVPRSLHVFGFDSKSDAVAITLAKQRLRLAAFFQMTYPGAPAIYYGDEVGVTGGDDPYNRATYPWPDLGGQPDDALLADFRALTRLRSTQTVLRRGRLDAPLYVDAHVIVLARQLGSTWAITATNNAAEAQTVEVTLPAESRGAAFVDAIDGGAVVDPSNGRLLLLVPPMWGRVLVSR